MNDSTEDLKGASTPETRTTPDPDAALSASQREENQRRVDGAQSILSYYVLGGGDPEHALHDLLTDLMHRCRHSNVLDFDTELRIARDNFNAEIRGNY